MSSNPSKVTLLVGPVSIGGPGQQVRIFVECVPSNLIDVVRETVHHIAHISGPKNHSTTSQSLNRSIVDAQMIRARLKMHVVPQNLLFIFGECAQTLVKSALELPIADRYVDRGLNPLCRADDEQGAAQQKPDANAWAVVFCHINDAQPLRDICGGPQDNTQDQRDCYQVTGAELDGLKKLLDEVIDHGAILSGNKPPQRPYSCDQLGVCQSAAPRCAGCTPKPPANPVPARDYAPSADDNDNPTSLAAIAVMLTEVLVVLIVVAALCGVVGYWVDGLS